MGTLTKAYSPDLVIAIYRNAKPDFVELNLHPLGLVVLPLFGDTFKQYVQHLNLEKSEYTLNLINKNYNKFKSDKGHHFAIVPVKPEKVNVNVYMKIRLALLLIFPSDFNITGIIEFILSDNLYTPTLIRNFDYKVQRISDGSADFHLSLEKEGGDLTSISDFVIHFVDRLSRWMTLKLPIKVTLTVMII